MNEFISKMDVYIQKELKEKTLRIALLTFLLILPGIMLKALVLLFLSSSLIVYDIRHQKAELLYIMPFSRKELFIYNIIFFTFLVIITSSITALFIGGSFIIKLKIIAESLILLFAIFGLQMIFSGFELDALVWSFLITFLDVLFGSIGSSNIQSASFNPYSLISFTRQGNMILALIFSLILLYLGYWSYVIKGGEN
ncbi:MAG: hypothetical protein ACPLSA_02305 [Caldanaerobacter sp.]|uniref:ABC-2 family transporter protein n=1 Tax=Thermoanaerobacter uzonensis DSM 18761 TaxID=1123369 RepID=A0A1M4TJT3_9THEO|nr:hypothetical protein [Thermoanaerobacter uzonensis]SHE44749.1 hypothetical protein SAMN02745195_00388 [Thermoanaerobacter uzonensis DSM 18761]